jgi:phosphate-selective porin OprO/OprP
LTTILAPNREFGLMLFGSLGPYRQRSLNLNLSPFGFDDWLSYQVGFFSGTPDGTNPGLNPISAEVFDSQRSTLANKAFEGRVILNPFINYQNSVLEPLAFGIGGSSQIVNNETLLPGLLSPGLNPMFLYQNVVDECGVVQFLNGFCPSVRGNGPRTRIHPSIFWHYKKFGLIFEAGNTLQTLTPLEKTKLNETVLPHLKQINQAAQMQFVYNLTSEKYRYLGMIPEQDFKFFEKGATGAWQIIFQMGVLKIDPNTFNDFYTVNNQKIFWYSDPRISIQHAQSFTFTLNWYWNKYFRISTEYDQTQYRGGCSTGGINSPVTPGCLTAPTKFIRAENSEVLNRPTEKLIMQRFVLAF